MDSNLIALAFLCFSSETLFFVAIGRIRPVIVLTFKRESLGYLRLYYLNAMYVLGYNILNLTSKYVRIEDSWINFLSCIKRVHVDLRKWIHDNVSPNVAASIICDELMEMRTKKQELETKIRQAEKELQAKLW
ncbi:hypothetical protein RIF29_00538 [Crotalaria pallida]|uniref:Uncharacterized protein n=1 Tax=Crotalaria pallida TaxID=3830 RepID=A0AAN9IVP8_CROPI